MFMFLSKKKKKLWSACQKRFQQYNPETDAMPSVQPQRHHPQRPLRPQQQPSAMMDQQDILPPSYSQMKCSGRCCCSMRSMMECSENNNNNNGSQQQLLNSLNIPQSVYSNNYYEERVDDALHPMEMESGSEEMSIEQDSEIRTDGCYSESYGDNSTDCNEGDDYDQRKSLMIPVMEEELKLPFHQTSTMNNSKSIMTTAENVLRNCCCLCADSVSNESGVGNNCQHHQQNQNSNYFLNNNVMAATPVHSTVTSAITATTSAFRLCCCGRGSLSNESSIGTYPYPQTNRNLTINNNNNNSKNNYNFCKQRTTTTTTMTTNNNSSGITGLKEQFKAFLKKLTESQVDTLYQVVEYRFGGADAAKSNHHRAHQLSDCILVPRETIGGEEPNVIACRLWLWPDLKTSTELKRIPMCPNGMEQVYVCCNPAHWNRILIPEAAPPPYQQTEMDELKPEDRAPSEKLKEDGGVSTVSGSTTGLQVQIPESFTTNGEDHSLSSLTWCQIAYWELTQRVGARYEATNSTVNIYSEGSGGMCLRDLAEKKATPTSSSVQKTRQKIGLGITLSQEADGVWLYNRSEAPIFIHSPTLNEDNRHVSKVPPGYCLNAYDKNRARTQKHRVGAQTGPEDPFSMQLSFAKGWGYKYHRANITECQCWLEVLFSQR